MNKKAQIPVFIMLGLFILVIFGVFFYIRGSQSLGDYVPQDLKPLRVFVEQCIKDSAEYGTYVLGVQGGKIHLDNEHFEDLHLKVAYAYTDKITLPSETLMQNELGAEINRNIKTCVNRFIDFPQFNVTDGVPKTETEFTMDKIIVNVQYPIKVENKGRETDWQNFRVELDVRMLTLLTNIKGLLAKVEQDKESFDALYLDNLGVKTYILPFEDAYLYVFEDSRSLLKNEPYLFMFAVKR